MNLLNLLLVSMTTKKAVEQVTAKTGLSEKQAQKLMKLAIPILLKFLTKMLRPDPVLFPCWER